jgi:siroheme synthase-like protein
VTARYPALLDLTDSAILVVGGGRVALRKVEGLLAGGGSPDLLAPELCSGLAGMATAFGLTHRAVEFADGDTNGYAVVIAATNDAVVNRRVAEEARRNHAWVNVVDDAEVSNFTVPATLRQADLLVAVSTGGGSPLLAARVRERLGDVVTPALGRTATRLQAVRDQVRARWPDDEQRRRAFWESLITEEFLDCAIAGKDEEVESRIEACLSRS